jgi:hypothetical protein
MPVNRLLIAAAVAYGIPGVVLLFGADEVLRSADGGASSPMALWLLGLLGGTLLAISLLNWIQRHTMIGGIYGRPLLIANVLVLANAFFSSLRMWRTTHDMMYAAVALVTGVLLLAFGRRLFVTPAAVGSDAAGTS